MQLAADEARRRFTAAPVARLATADAHGVPHLVPVTFAVDLARRPHQAGAGPAAATAGEVPALPDMLYFAVDHKPKRTAALRRLRNIAENPRVCLLVDHYCADWTRLWWARADGVARVICDPARRGRPVELLCAAYPQYRERPPEGPVVAVTVTRWSGWAFAEVTPPPSKG